MGFDVDEYLKNYKPPVGAKPTGGAPAPVPKEDIEGDPVEDFDVDEYLKNYKPPEAKAAAPQAIPIKRDIPLNSKEFYQNNSNSATSNPYNSSGALKDDPDRFSLQSRVKSLYKQPEYESASALKKPQMILDAVQDYSSGAKDIKDDAELFKAMATPKYYKNLAKVGAAGIAEGGYKIAHGLLPISNPDPITKIKVEDLVNGDTTGKQNMMGKLWDPTKDETLKYLHDVQQKAQQESPEIATSPFRLPTSLKKTLAEGPGIDPTIGARIKDVAKQTVLGGAEFAEGLTTPSTVAALAPTVIPGFGTAAATSFMPGMIEGTYQGGKKAVGHVLKGEFGPAARESVKATASALMTAGLAKGILGEPVGAPIEKLADTYVKTPEPKGTEGLIAHVLKGRQKAPESADIVTPLEAPKTESMASDQGINPIVEKLTNDQKGAIDFRSKPKQLIDALYSEAEKAGLPMEQYASEKYGINKEDLQYIRDQTGSRKERKLLKTLRKSEIMSPEAAREVRSLYDAITNKATMEWAQAEVKLDPEKELINFLTNEKPEAGDYAKAIEMARIAKAEGDINTEIKLAEHAAKTSTTHGQAIQALAMIGRMSPEGVLRYAAQQLGKRGKKLTPELANEIKRLADEVKNAPEGRAKQEKEADLARKINPHTWTDKFWHVMYANILSGAFTHIKNLKGNVSSLAIETVRATISHPHEIVKAVRGMAKGFGLAVPESWETLKHGKMRMKYSDSNVPIKFGGKYNPLKLTNYVGNLLAATDVLFSKSMEGFEAGGQVRVDTKGVPSKLGRMSKQFLGGGKEEFSKAWEENMKHEDVQTFGEYSTYNQDSAGVIGAMAKAVGSATTEAKILKPLAMFTRVVGNVFNNYLDLTPIGITRVLRETVRGGWNGPGAGGEGGGPNVHHEWFGPEFKHLRTGRAKYQGIVRSVLGTALMTAIAKYALEGSLSGHGPTDQNKRQQLEATGWKPFSRKTDTAWEPYETYGSIAGILAIIGSYADQVKYSKIDSKELPERLSAAMMGTVNFFLDHSFLSGVADFINAASDPTGRGAKYAPRLIANTMGMAIPAILKQGAKIMDPTAYDTKTVKQMILNSVGYHTGLKKRINVWGEPVPVEMNQSLMSREIKKDPVRDFLVEKDLYISLPNKNTLVDDNSTGEKRPITDDEYYYLIKKSGPLIHEELENSLSEYELMDIDEISEDIRKKVKVIRDDIKDEISFGISPKETQQDKYENANDSR